MIPGTEGKSSANNEDSTVKKNKPIAILVIVCALAVVIFQNRSPVQAHFLFVTVEMPVILLLVLTAALGFILGMLVSFYARPGAREEQ